MGDIRRGGQSGRCRGDALRLPFHSTRRSLVSSATLKSYTSSVCDVVGHFETRFQCLLELVSSSTSVHQYGTGILLGNYNMYILMKFGV
ncbi:hypothetical protein EVAR_61395_1 [Eumeta japonica]|uniref:Uncharacterized protein n=1 Tax=Eumeta variegata TaxID=151549 RepID=A0A4C1Z921_EUMVA|nr:hypothetical protein EVAR_61395_1 [Eumeta japonica]